MKSKSFAVLMLMLLLASTLIQTLTIQPVKASGIIVVPDDYSTIQAAINAANPGDTIFVYNGTYYENVVVNKTVALIGENKSNTIVDGGYTGNVIES